MQIINLREAFRNKKTRPEVLSVTETVGKAIKSGEIKKEQLSIRNIAESILGDAGMKAMDRNNDEGNIIVGLHEAVDPVSLTAFTNITGLLVLQYAVEAYQAPEYIGMQLCTEETSRDDNVRIPGLAPIDDKVLVVKEGQEYPTVSFGEDYISTPTSQKRGARIALTREMVFFDRTNQLGELSSALGARLATDREKRILSEVLGLTNSFSRKGVARNNYVSSADPRINLTYSQDLTDWTSLDAAQQVFNAYTDDRTDAEPISVIPDTLLVTPSYEFTAKRIWEATELRVGTQSGAQQAYGPNIIRSKIQKIYTSQWITKLLVDAGVGTGASTLARAKGNWFFGNFKKAFGYRTLFPFAVQAIQSDKDIFDRDVVGQWRVDERGTPYTKAPWQVGRFLKDSAY